MIFFRAMRLRLEATNHDDLRELARRLRKTNIAKVFGFELAAAEPGRAVLKMRVRSRHRQIHNVVHGGILAALADTAAAFGVYLALPRGTPLATVEMKINYLEPVHAGVLRAEGRMLRKGKNLAVAECDVREDALLVAKALLTFSIGKKKK